MVEGWESSKANENGVLLTHITQVLYNIGSKISNRAGDVSSLHADH